MPQTYAYRWAVQAMVTIYGFGAGLLGLALLAAGPSRFVSTSFAAARLVPGGAYAWGLIFLLAGAVTLLGAWRKNRRLLSAGLLAQAFGFLIFDFGLIVTAFTDPKTPVTGCVTYAMTAAACLATWGAAKELT